MKITPLGKELYKSLSTVSPTMKIEKDAIYAIASGFGFGIYIPNESPHIENIDSTFGVRNVSQLLSVVGDNEVDVKVNTYSIEVKNGKQKVVLGRVFDESLKDYNPKNMDAYNNGSTIVRFNYTQSDHKEVTHMMSILGVKDISIVKDEQGNLVLKVSDSASPGTNEFQHELSDAVIGNVTFNEIIAVLGTAKSVTSFDCLHSGVDYNMEFRLCKDGEGNDVVLQHIAADIPKEVGTLEYLFASAKI